MSRSLKYTLILFYACVCACQMAATAASDSKSVQYEKVPDVAPVKASDDPLALSPSTEMRAGQSTYCGDTCWARVGGCSTTAAYDAAWAKRDGDRKLEIKGGVLYYTSHHVTVNYREHNCIPMCRWCCCGCGCTCCCPMPRVTRYFRATDLNDIKRVSESDRHENAVLVVTSESDHGIIISDVKDPARCVDSIRSAMLKKRGETVASAAELLVMSKMAADLKAATAEFSAAADATTNMRRT